MPRLFRIATRQSPLAMWQAETVRDRLQAAHPDLAVTLLPLSTRADRDQTRTLAAIGGKGLFIKELETALVSGEADLAVHSMKDVVPVLPKGLVIQTVMEREDPNDALVSKSYASLDELPDGARVGTCSPRRQAQLLVRYPHLDILPLRGNVNTRLARLDNGDFAAILLACAGLKRLGFAERIRSTLDHDVCLPAVGQGIIGIETREDDDEVHDLLKPLHDTDSAHRLLAERAFSGRLHGGCSSPIAAHATLHDQTISLTGRVIAHDGQDMLSDRIEGPVQDAQRLGEALAMRLIDRGARTLLDAAEQQLETGQDA